MPQFPTNQTLPVNQIQILSLEQKYMQIICNLANSNLFQNDLQNLKNYTQNNYSFIQSQYDKKNKIDVGLERLIRRNIYGYWNFHAPQNTMVGPYYSPLSSDIAFETNDAIINIDSKTIDEIGNSTDISYFHFEANQCSFKNNGLGASNYNINGINYPCSGVEVKTSLPMRDPATGKPILTFVIRVIYRDNGFGFNFAQNRYNFSVTCLPNGELSSLFKNDLVINFKTYTYHKKSITYSPIFLTGNTQYNFQNNFLRDFPNTIINFPYSYASIKTKIGIFDGRDLWVPVKRTGQAYNPKGFYLEKIKSGHTARIKYDDLIQRLDSQNKQWKGHLETQI